VVLYGVLVAAALLYLLPLMAMMFTSLKTMPEITGLAPFERNTILTPPQAPSFAA
jgi:glucose/mannose transport system permease protein